jgi:hypothetical protein
MTDIKSKMCIDLFHDRIYFSWSIDFLYFSKAFFSTTEAYQAYDELMRYHNNYRNFSMLEEILDQIRRKKHKNKVFKVK